MPTIARTNRQWVLNARPKGEPDAGTLRWVEAPAPVPVDGQMLLRTVYLSLDPYMRGRMSDAPSYAASVGLGEVMVGATVAQVIESRLERFKPGDWVLAYGGWQDYSLSDGKGVVPLGEAPQHPSWALGILGMPGFTAWAGLKEIGRPQPGETLVVAAATGPVGATVGQIGKLMGCRVVGVAGGPDKCAYAVETLGFDACVDHKAGTLPDALAAACPDGIDVYFENVGGAVLDAVLPRLNTGARIPLCGLVSQYNATTLPPGPDRMNWLLGQLLRKRVLLRGFIIFDDFGHLYPQFAREMGEWVASGKLKYREEMIEGLGAAPAAFIGLLRGQNFGKRVVRVAGPVG